MTFHWHTEPLLLLAILLPGWLYALWTGPLRRHILPQEPFSLLRAFSFYSGLATFYIAVGSPIDSIGERYLFSVHMLQHLLIMYVGPILCIAGLPGRLLDATWGNWTWFHRVFRVAVHPVVAGASFTLILSLWHVPALYEAALVDKRIHILEHVTITVPAFFIIWKFFSESNLQPVLSYPGRILYLFALMVGQLPLFGVLSMSDEILYPTYEWAPRIIGMSALEDQIVGGIMMKVGGMILALPIMGYCFWQWARSTEQD